MGRSLTQSSYLRIVSLERKTMPPLDYPIHWRMALRTLGEDLLESYMMRTLEESLSGSSAPSWLGTLRGFRNLPSCMVLPGLESPPSSIFWSYSSKATQLRSMRELLDPRAISSQPALSVRVRSWPSIKTGTSRELSLTDFSTVLPRMRPFLLMRKASSGILRESMQSFSSVLTNQLRSLTRSRESSGD